MVFGQNLKVLTSTKKQCHEKGYLKGSSVAQTSASYVAHSSEEYIRKCSSTIIISTSYDCRIESHSFRNQDGGQLSAFYNNVMLHKYLLMLSLLLMPAGSSPLLSLGGLAPGDYRLRVVAVGSSCDSSQRQRLNVRFTV